METSVVCSKMPRYDGILAKLFGKKNKFDYVPISLKANDRGVTFCTYLTPAENIKIAKIEISGGFGATIIDHGHNVTLFFERFKIITKDKKRYYFAVATQLPNGTDQKDSIKRLSEIFKIYNPDK